jgi:hypothetical protein
VQELLLGHDGLGLRGRRGLIELIWMVRALRLGGVGRRAYIWTISYVGRIE